MSALRSLRSSDRTIAFRPWIYQIARNACIDQLRRQKRAQEVSIDSDDFNPQDEGRISQAGPAPTARFRSARTCTRFSRRSTACPSSQHEILVLRELEGLSYDGDREPHGPFRGGRREHAVQGAPGLEGRVRRDRHRRALPAHAAVDRRGRRGARRRTRPRGAGSSRSLLRQLPSRGDGNGAAIFRDRGAAPRPHEARAAQGCGAVPDSAVHAPPRRGRARSFPGRTAQRTRTGAGGAPECDRRGRSRERRRSAAEGSCGGGGRGSDRRRRVRRPEVGRSFGLCFNAQRWSSGPLGAGSAGSTPGSPGVDRPCPIPSVPRAVSHSPVRGRPRGRWFRTGRVA